MSARKAPNYFQHGDLECCSDAALKQAYTSSAEHLSFCGRCHGRCFKNMSEYIKSREFMTFRYHLVAHWASPLSLYYWSYTDMSSSSLWQWFGPSWKGWLSWVPQASQINSDTNTQRSVTGAFGRSLLRELLACWMETELTWCKLKEVGCGSLRWETASTLLRAVSSRSVYWLTRSDTSTKHYPWNYNISYLYVTSLPFEAGHLWDLKSNWN